MKDLCRRVKEEIRANDKLIVSVKAHEKAEYDVYVEVLDQLKLANATSCLLYTSPSPRDVEESRMPSSA